MNITNKSILNRYTSGHFSTEDERQMINNLADDQLLPEMQELLAQDWENTAGDEQNQANLKRIQYQLNYEINTQQQNPRKSNQKRILRFIATTAAAVMLPLLFMVGFRYYSCYFVESPSAMAQIIAPIGARVQFTLPDGSSGWLNGGSTLQYPVDFTHRLVQLSGEGFFDVSHDPLNPFVVTGTDAKVVVLGTRFNVNMWPNESITEVILESGKVKFSFEGQTAPTILLPGQRLIFDRHKKIITVDKVTVDKHVNWKEGRLVFRGDNMSELALKLSSWYNVDVVLDDDETLNDYRFRATFKNETLPEVLRLLKMSSPIDFDIIDSKKMNDGTLTRKKIILKMMHTK